MFQDIKRHKHEEQEALDFDYNKKEKFLQETPRKTEEVAAN